MKRLQAIRKRIVTACERVDRNPTEIILIGASKYQPIEKMAALAQAGLHDFGENYWQELKTKREALTEPVRWHFIGSIQRRKAKYLAGSDILIHSLDNLEVATELDHRTSNVITRALVQVNLAGEGSKGGLPPEAVQEFLQSCTPLPHLQIEGLMTLPPYSEDPEAVRPHFQRLRQLMDEMNRLSVYKNPLTVLSMGMSHDFEIAIEEGATMVRIGTALFGERVKT